MRTLSQLNILEVIQADGIELRRKGKLYMALCSYHNDWDHHQIAEYQVSNRFVCYGCNEKGDAIDFYFLGLASSGFESTLLVFKRKV